MACHKPRQSEVAFPQRTEGKEGKREQRKGKEMGEQLDLGVRIQGRREGYPHEERGGSYGRWVTQKNDPIISVLWKMLTSCLSEKEVSKERKLEWNLMVLD